MNFADENGILEIIIYVILMVGGLAASAYRNYMKKKNQPQKIPEESMADFPDAAFESDYDSEVYTEEETDRDTSVEIELAETEKAEAEQKLQLNEQKIVQEPVSSEGQAVFESTKNEILADDYLESQRYNQSDNSESDYYMDSDDMEDSEGFDLKKAIIYSEIMNPKYL
jgi:tetrahydrodipicolinate N-succinyltransferase